MGLHILGTVPDRLADNFVGKQLHVQPSFQFIHLWDKCKAQTHAESCDRVWHLEKKVLIYEDDYTVISKARLTTCRLSQKSGLDLIIFEYYSQSHEQ